MSAKEIASYIGNVIDNNHKLYNKAVSVSFDKRFASGLPDGIFSNQKSKFG
jgi:hypothetical protein